MFLVGVIVTVNSLNAPTTPGDSQTSIVASIVIQVAGNVLFLAGSVGLIVQWIRGRRRQKTP